MDAELMEKLIKDARFISLVKELNQHEISANENDKFLNILKNEFDDCHHGSNELNHIYNIFIKEQ